MVLLERDDELTRVARALNGATTGRGSALVVTGEAGIGKSALVAAAAAQAPPGTRTLRAACDPLTTPRVLGPVLDLASALGGEAARAAWAHDRDRIFEAVLEGIAGPGSALIVLEDLHWADEATTDWVRFTARRASALPVALLVTLRDEPAARAALGDLVGTAGVEVVSLRPLTLAAVVALAGGDTGRAREVYGPTGGNPFLVRELLSAARDGVPLGVRDAVAARLRRLPPGARTAVEVASLVPGAAPPWLVTAAGRVDPEDVDQAQAADLLRPDGPDVVFPHELVRLAVAETVPAGRAAMTHGRICDALEAHYGRRTDPVRLAHHAAAAGDTRRAALAAWRATESAVRACAHRDAARHGEIALHHLDGLDGDEQVRLLVTASRSALALGDGERAQSLVDRALERARAVGGIPVALALVAAAGTAWSAGRSGDGYRASAEAVAAVEGMPPCADVAAVLADHATLRMLARDLHTAVHVGDRAVAMARASSDDAVAAAALHAVGTARLLRDEEEGVRLLHEAIALSRRVGEPATAARALLNLGSGAGEVRRYDTALPALVDAARTAERLEMLRALGYVRAWQGRVHLEVGDWSAAHAYLDGALEGTTSPAEQIVRLTARVRLAVREGDLDDAPAALALAHELAARTGDLQRLWPLATARAELADATGRLPDVVAELRLVLDQAVAASHRWARGELGYWLWRAGAPTDLPPSGTPFDDVMAGRPEAAAERWGELGCRFERGLALAESARTATARAGYDELLALGALPAARRARARLLRRGVTDVPPVPAARTGGHPFGLTARQGDVLALLCEGASNSDIAARLVISPKTAEHHVSAVLQRMGARSRAEAVALALRAR